jgi:cytochrome c oxidase assembly protein subunit 15
VRLTRSGLSIVEWNPISGTIPPIGEQAWQAEFHKYQQTPEFKIVNAQMTLAEYRYIFYIEWIHRVLARLAGLAYAVPACYFLFKKVIPFKEFGVYVLIGILFIAQAFLGWYMVASGLVDRPSVSHYRLTIHLLMALTLLGLTLWVGLGHQYGFERTDVKKRRARLTGTLALIAFGILIVQIIYGGLSAGTKAGYVSDTWPLMSGSLVPAGLFVPVQKMIDSPQTIAFIHRWFAWLGLIAIPLVIWTVRREDILANFRKPLLWLSGLVALQIALGILTVLTHVPLTLALLHQANALALFALGVYFLHRLWAR